MALLSTPSAIVAHRFLIVELAGTGGMGSVYKTRDLLTGQLAALKILHAAAPTSQEAERFARETRLLSTLEHPGIVRYVADGQTADGQPFLAMEWLEGHDLARHLESHQLSLDECLLLIRQIATALSIAHRRGILHRDLKPSNLVLEAGAG
jgi:serine/threonine protein kinase